MSSDLGVAWAAGLIEGEGCITLHTNAPYLLVDMCDEDVIRKLQSVFPVGTVRGPYTHKNKPAHKPRWRFDAYGTKAIPIIKEIYPLLGKRRRDKIDSVLATYKATHGS